MDQIKAKIEKRGKKIDIFCYIVFAFFTIQFSFLLITEEVYDRSYFLNVQGDLLMINGMFLFTLFKFRSVSKKHHISINKRFMCIHLTLLVLLIISFSWKFIFYNLSYHLD